MINDAIIVFRLPDGLRKKAQERAAKEEMGFHEWLRHQMRKALESPRPPQ